MCSIVIFIQGLGKNGFHFILSTHEDAEEFHVCVICYFRNLNKLKDEQIDEPVYPKWEEWNVKQLVTIASTVLLVFMKSDGEL